MEDPGREVICGYELSVVKWADKTDTVFAVIWASVGLGVLALSDGWFGWGPNVTEARWLVQVRDQSQVDDIQAVRTVRTAFTERGAKRAARQIRRVLVSGDEEAIRALPDLIH